MEGGAVLGGGSPFWIGDIVKRALLPSTNPAGLGSAIAAIYAAVVMTWNATHHHGVISPPVIIAALGAAAFLYTRFKVTPVADPRDGNGAPLATAPPPPPPPPATTPGVKVIP